MSIFDKFFGAGRKANVIEVAHGKARYDITFSEGSIENGEATVGELRSQCTYVTKTPAQNIRLLFRGKNLTNDTVRLNSIGMKSGSKVLCMASQSATTDAHSSSNPTPPSQQSPAQAQKTQTTKAPLDQLSDLLRVIESDLYPQVIQFTTRTPSDAKLRHEQHDKLAELLLQKLFALDGITCADGAQEQERDAVRSKRREGVKYTQGLLDSVDQVTTKETMEAEVAEASDAR